MPTNDPRPTKNQRRDEARAKALAMRKEQERKAKRNRLLAIIGLSVAVVALVAVAFFIVKQDRDTAAANSNVAYGNGAEGVVAPKLADVTAPSTANESGGVPVSADGVGKAGDGDVEVKVYFDFMCPWCGKFDRANSSELETLAASGDVTITYHPLAFLDGNSRGSFFSTRASNALAVIADESPEHMTDFMTAMYAEGTQPAEGTTGLSDAEIADVAKGVGVPESVTKKFTSTVDGTFTISGEDGEQDGTWRTFAPWMAATTSQANTDLGGLSTPTVLIDGQKFTGDLYTAGPLTEAVQAAVAAKG